MAKWILYSDEQLRVYAEWLAERPDSIKEMSAKYGLLPDRLFRLKTTGQRVKLYSLSENGTVTVDVLAKFNPDNVAIAVFGLERRVFGIDPADLEECDLPEGVEIEMAHVLLCTQETTRTLQ